MIERFVDPVVYWKFKGYGRIMLILAIAVYGIGLVLMRIHVEKQVAEGTYRDHEVGSS